MKKLELSSNSENIQVYLEIQQEIDYLIQRLVSLRAKVDELTQTELNTEKQVEVLLSFKDNSQMIFWSGGSIHLSKKQYLLVKTIWNANNRTATLDVIEENIWNLKEKDDADRSVLFIPRHTIFELVNRTRNSVYQSNFPYEIVSNIVKQIVKQNDKHCGHCELQGYSLVVKKT
jgi:hypothetical protein